MKKRMICLALLGLSLASCAQGKTTSVASSAAPKSDVFSENWSYDATNDVYYQLRVADCTAPVSEAYESMAIYVPAAYLTGSKNSNGYYTCSVNSSGKAGNYTASTAPIVFPVNTPGYAGQASPSAFSVNRISTYLKAGFVYVLAGMRGKDVQAGEAPWGVTDLKAAVRAYRYHASDLPGDTAKIYTFGMSGGGAQSSLMGASGDSPLYTPYLTAIGAYTQDGSGKTLSDAVNGSMCWCPITALDRADEAYEWNLGQFYSSSTRATTTWTSTLSQDMADDYAAFINALGLKNGSETLTLSSSAEGRYLAGNYYDYLVSVVAESLNNYLSDTYADASAKASYVSGLGSWASYDSATDKASISSLSGFIQSQKNAQKPVGAFDGLSRGQGENSVFRIDDANSGKNHFDAALSALLAQNNGKYSALSGYVDYRNDFTSDLALKDAEGTSMEDRVQMYNPMYYLSSYYQGAGTSTVAPHWRIRTGIKQPDTALNTEVNLALALKGNSAVKDVDFATVWDQAHVTAERKGSSNADANFISWVESLA
jgi:hypothetical protein